MDEQEQEQEGFDREQFFAGRPAGQLTAPVLAPIVAQHESFVEHMTRHFGAEAFNQGLALFEQYSRGDINHEEFVQQLTPLLAGAHLVSIFETLCGTRLTVQQSENGAFVQNYNTETSSMVEVEEVEDL